MIARGQSPWPTLHSSIVGSCWIPCSLQSKKMGPIVKWLKLLKLWITEGRGEFTFLPTKKTPLQVHFYVGTMIEPPPSWRCVAMAVLEGQISLKKTGITCRPGKPSGPFAEALCLWQGFSAFTCAQTHPHSQKVMSWVEQGFTLPLAGESGDTIPEIDWHPRSLSSKCRLVEFHSSMNQIFKKIPINLDSMNNTFLLHMFLEQMFRPQTKALRLEFVESPAKTDVVWIPEA